jgi:molybdenum cofactor cytidylyltransferase
MKTVAGLILAAGKSERMGRPKALLKVFGRSFLEHIVHEAENSALNSVTIVLGHQSHMVLDALPQFRVSSVINSEYELGQLSSLQCGLGSLAGRDIDGAMVFLIDHPFVHSLLINQLIEAFDSRPVSIVVPSFRHRRGHPMIFGFELFDELLRAPIDQGAFSVVRKHEDSILHLEVNEPGVLIDIDTPEAYNEFVVSAGKE